jgi:hypothetical protein
VDDIVRQAMAKWPNVPDCFGWLALDARGQWLMRDDRVQALGTFQDGPSAARGSVLQHDKLIGFIGRNYASNEQGWWYFQNGPQRVFVELALTPFIWRLNDTLEVTAHTGALALPKACLVDEAGRAYLTTDLGFGLVHTMDVPRLAKALDQGVWACEACQASELPQRFGYALSPQAEQARKPSRA